MREKLKREKDWDWVRVRRGRRIGIGIWDFPIQGGEYNGKYH